jgi:hypothetical protein
MAKKAALGKKVLIQAFVDPRVKAHLRGKAIEQDKSLSGYLADMLFDFCEADLPAASRNAIASELIRIGKVAGVSLQMAPSPIPDWEDDETEPVKEQENNA